MIALDATTQSLELGTSAAVSTDYVVSWVDNTATTFVPGSGHGNVSTATTTTIVAAPAASTQRGVKQISLVNRSATAAQIVTVKKDVSATEYVLQTATLAPGDSLHYDESGWRVLDGNGRLKTNAVETGGPTGRTQLLWKNGTASDAAGYWYCSSKDAGFPGAWAPGTPGLAGRATDGTTAADAGCIPFQNPATGGMYLTDVSMWSSTAHGHLIFDCLWVNSGIVVTTTTSQTLNSVAFPARDINGSANGEGLMIGILAVAALGNAAVISNSTVSYTNEAGTAGRTATLAAIVGMQIPATPVIGTLVWFLLQAGDKGVRSIQSITLGTSLVSGTVSLLVARPVVYVNTQVANIGVNVLGRANPGIRLYNGTCLLHASQTSATTATVVSGTFVEMER